MPPGRAHWWLNDREVFLGVDGLVVWVLYCKRNCGAIDCVCFEP